MTEPAAGLPDPEEVGVIGPEATPCDRLVSGGLRGVRLARTTTTQKEPAMRSTRYCTILVMALALAACGHGNEPASDAAAPQAQAQAGTSPSAANAPAADPSAVAQANTTRPLEVSDLDVYAKGMQKEIELRQASSDKAAKAKADHDQETEVTALAEMTSAEVNNAGARAAGVDAARYDFIKHAVDHVLGTVSMNAAMAKMEGGAGMQQSDPYAGLDPDVAAALKAREAELGKLREDNMAILVNATKL